jgi:Na+-translocating ferredoxin:NAD+ oxidoreductase RnfC subunit
VFGEDDTEAANALSEIVGKSNLFTFRMLKMKYPRTHEKLIVSALTGRELTYPLTALDAGYVIVTPRVCADVFAAFAMGKPSVDCYIGVDGDAVTYQRTLCVPRGTSYRHLIDVC